MSNLRLPTVYLATDERMMMHCCTTLNENGIPASLLSHQGMSSKAIAKRYKLWQDNCRCMDTPRHEENPIRILAIYRRLMELEDRLLAQVYPWNYGATAANQREEEHISAESRHILRRFLRLPCIPADREAIELAHSAEHYEFLQSTATMSEHELQELCVENDLYFNNWTFLAASLAAGAVIECVNAVTDPNTVVPPTTRAIALVRPPGHHAAGNNRSDRYDAQGFCYFNNVAIAAKHAIASGRVSRVFILDWDIHHGNGIQDSTYDDKNIFYFSIHRGVYPFTGYFDETGEGNAVGTNCNIMWDDSVGNEDYAEAFHRLVLPAIVAFEPDLILVSSGFDAAEGDILGDCRLTPAMYYAMTNSLLGAVGREIPIVVVLEGGYNLDVIANCAEGIALALLDEPWKEDRTQYESKTFWSTKSILPVTSSQVLQHSNPFSLQRWLRSEDRPLKAHAFRSINRTVDALRKAECRM
mmetsp:Transcript_28185/g.60042  ORF Transcript_28185/g.60042 Transcript_28185/m.60042 type:complete len:471 (-) Transcript_28185:56-1468(-)